MRAIFQFSELGEPYTFRELDTGNLRPPQQFDISFIRCRIGFIRIANFFYILYLFLKKLQTIRFDLPNLSSTTYPSEPILQNLSSRTYPILPMLQWILYG